MTSLLVGFDSAWAPGNTGAIVAVIQHADGAYRELGDPQAANFESAGIVIRQWQADEQPDSTVILIDQPIVVTNATGQRPVENIVSSCVSRRHGGMQPTNRGKAEMFGPKAPVWEFVRAFGGASNPLTAKSSDRVVFETYPVLALIALGWVLKGPRPKGRLPKYNPANRKFAIEDWRSLCLNASKALAAHGLARLAQWALRAGAKGKPTKGDQDKLDACICLLVALYLSGQRDCLVVGDYETGYIVVPDCPDLRAELEDRCRRTSPPLPRAVQTFRWTT